MRTALAAILSHRYQFEVAQAEDAAGAVELCKSRCPAMVILDLMMPGLDTFSAVHEIRQLRPTTRMMILTSHSDRSLVARAREYKVNGYVLKSDPPDEMDYAIRSVLRGSFYIPPSLREDLYFNPVPENPPGQLTTRKKSVFSLTPVLDTCAILGPQ